MSRKTLIAKGPTYFSQGDEDAFFGWLTSISCVETVEGHLRNLHITEKRPPRKLELRELIALFSRYRMSLKPLASLKTTRNAAWFAESNTA